LAREKSERAGAIPTRHAAQEEERMISKRIRKGLVALAAPLLLAAGPAVASKDTATIGVVVPTLAAQFWSNYIDFMKKGAKERFCRSLRR
jgi:ABC-type sugar transport system substrate-binding protein